jgi:hypothetical protein
LNDQDGGRRRSNDADIRRWFLSSLYGYERWSGSAYCRRTFLSSLYGYERFRRSHRRLGDFLRTCSLSLVLPRRLPLTTV